MSEPTRVLIADDHELFRMGICSLIGTMDGFEVIGEASSGSETLALVAEHSPDLLILDYNMPDGTGLDVIRSMQDKKLANLAVILLTAVSSPIVFDEAIEAGVSAVVTKRGSGDELLTAINSVRESEQYVSEDVQVALESAEDLRSLTRRETEVLLTLLAGQDTTGVAETLNISFKTAETHKTRVMQKMNVHSTQALLGRARALGLFSES